MTQELRQLQKAEAIKRLELLKLLPNVITDFKNTDTVYYSERQNKIFDGILYWISNNEDYERLVKEFEENYDALVYHTQLTRFSYGLCLSMLFVSKYQEEWEMEREAITNPYDGVIDTYAYVANLNEPDFSEIGRIGIIRKNGGISRVY